MPDIISVIIALVLVIVAAVNDLREFRIPNRLIVAGIVVGVSVIVIRAFTGEYIGNYILGTLAVIGMLTGLEFVLQLMVVSLITGFFTGIVELFLKKTREVSMGSSGIKAHGFHYAVGVLTGYVVVLVYRCVVVL